MAWTAIPIILDEMDPLEFKTVQVWCDKNIPTSNIAFEDELISALTIALWIGECQLQLLVCAEFLDKTSFAHATVQRWVESSDMSATQY